MELAQEEGVVKELHETLRGAQEEIHTFCKLIKVEEDKSLNSDLAFQRDYEHHKQELAGISDQLMAMEQYVFYKSTFNSVLIILTLIHFELQNCMKFQRFLERVYFLERLIICGNVWITSIKRMLLYKMRLLISGKRWRKRYEVLKRK